MKPLEKRRAVRRLVAREAAAATELARRIWQLAELALDERESSRLLADYLAARGFRVDRPLAALPTAFRAVWGRGRPVIGVLGEYDALPGCGSSAGERGHGCGHHLLGVGAAAGAVAAARMLAAEGRAGRVVYWGCPAEETLVGKAYMARDGAFRGLDACLAWHPGKKTVSRAGGGAAMDSLSFEFRGRTAHGSYAEAGRSALDAAVLADVAANYLREHVAENVRVHCVLSDGGRAPNVVPAYARSWYYVRGRDRAQADDVRRRLVLCARGAALATGTRLRVRRLSSLYNRLRNDALAELLLDNLKLMGGNRATAADARAARRAGLKRPQFNEGVEPRVETEPGRASSDEDSVSWLAPLGVFMMACWPEAVLGHHRETTLHGNAPYAYRGMLRAAQVIAGAAWDLAAGGRALRRARAEFRRAKSGFRWDPLVPARQRPPRGG